MHPTPQLGQNDTPQRRLPDVIRRPRALALWALAVTVPVATCVAFVLSYRGLVDFALSIGVPAWLAWAYPLMFDLPVVAGEAVLFVAAVDRKTHWRVVAWAWLVTIGFAVLSSAGNAGLLPPVMARALPPLVLAVLLGFGLGELRRHSAGWAVQRNASRPTGAPVKIGKGPSRWQLRRSRRHVEQITGVPIGQHLDRLDALDHADEAAAAGRSGLPPTVPPAAAAAVGRYRDEHGGQWPSANWLAANRPAGLGGNGTLGSGNRRKAREYLATAKAGANGGPPGAE